MPQIAPGQAGSGAGTGASTRPSDALARGFTLVELMVTLVIAAILLSVAVPGMGNLFRNQARSAVLNELTGALRFARAEAARNRRPTALCASSDGLRCEERRRSNYTDGWIVFLDSDGDGVKDADDANGDGVVDPLDEPVQRFFQPDAGADASLTLQDRVTLSGARRRVISFERTGMLRNASGGAQAVNERRFVYCDSAGVEQARAIYVTVPGITVLTLDEDGDGRDDYLRRRMRCP